MLHIQAEAWPALRDDLEPVLRLEHGPELVAHGELDLGTHPATGVRVNDALYDQWYGDGHLHCLTARWHEAGRKVLSGYILSKAAPFVNAPGVRMQLVLLYYVRPAYRHRGIGRRLFQVWEECMRDTGVQMLYTTTKVAEGKGHARFLEQMGYTANEVVFSRWIA